MYRVYVIPLFHNLLFYLFNDFVHPNFYFLLFLAHSLTFQGLLLTQFLLLKRAPCVPLIHESFTQGNELRTNTALFCSIVFIESTTVLSEVPPNLSLFFFC